LPGLLWQGFTRAPDAADQEAWRGSASTGRRTLAERAYRALVSARW